MTGNVSGATVTASGAITGGSLTDGTATITSGAASGLTTVTASGLVSGGSLDIDDVVVDGTTIGHTDDTDLMTLTSGTVTIAGTVAATTLTGNGAGITGISVTSIGTLAGASPLVFEGATADDYETTIAVTDPTADRTLTLPNATSTLATTTGSETFTNKTLTSPDINGGTVDGAAIGASSASTGAFTTASASGAVSLADGSAGSPALTNTGDTNTGLYFSAADAVAVATGGADRMIIDSNSEISLSNNDSGTSNTLFGKSAGLSLDAGSNYNVFVGEGVSDATMDDAKWNVGIGYQALSALTTGDYNTASGY
ncbi:MAG: hypothetical protein KAG66_15135, partial [Methylococcales bacterium]|nr:hypothetical protein [Methylococcales bacterium]